MVKAVNNHRTGRAVWLQNRNRARKAVVVLGGGGARGLSHLGAMEAIGEAGVQTERIVGVSIGSLMGGLCAVDSNIKTAQARAIELLLSSTFSNKCQRLMGAAARVSGHANNHRGDTSSVGWFSQWYGEIEKMMRHGHRLTKMIRGTSILSSEILTEAIDMLIPDIDLSETSTPLSIVAADLKSGHQVVLERGPIRKALLASSAIPGVFPPIQWDDMLLCDIGVLDALPMQVARSYASDLTIGVDVGSTLQRVETFRSAIDVMMRVEEIGERLCRRQTIPLADILIRPDVGRRPWFDFSDPVEVIESGLVAGRNAMRNQFRKRMRPPVNLPVEDIIPSR